MGLARTARSSGLVLATVAGLAAGAVLTGSLAPVEADLGSGDRPVFVPMTPCRIFDTRPGSDNVGPRSTPLGTADGYTVNGRGPTGNCTIPNDAVALTLNVTAVGATLQTNIRVFPTGAPLPLTSNLNPAPGAPPTPNAVTTDLSAAGQFTVYNFRGTVHVLADVAGYYVHHHHDDRYPTDAEVDTKIAAAIDSALPSPRSVVAVDSPDIVGSDPSIAIGANGYPIISYRSVTQQALKVAACGNATCSVARISTIDSSANVGEASSIAIRPGGNPIISYYDRTNERLKVASCNDPECASPAAFVIVDSVSDAGRRSSIAIGQDGNPVIAYTRSTGTTMWFARCTNAICLGTDKQLIGSGSGQPSIVVPASGNPVISYGDAGPTKLAVCGNPSCTTSSIQTLDPAGGSQTDSALGANGHPVIVFSEAIGPDVAVCNNAACTDRTVTPTGDFGNAVGVAVGADGIPVVAYYDDVDGRDLGVATCTSPQCTSFTLAMVDTNGSVGDGARIAIGSDGRPVIAYSDSTNGDLKVATL